MSKNLTFLSLESNNCSNFKYNQRTTIYSSPKADSSITRTSFISSINRSMVSQTSNPLGANRSYDPSDAIRFISKIKLLWFRKSLFEILYRRSNGNNNHSVNNNYNMRNRSNGEQNGNHVSTSKDDKFEVPLPFGYHMDLDFLRFCSEQANSGSFWSMLIFCILEGFI